MKRPVPPLLRHTLIACIVVIVAGSLYPYVGWRPLSVWTDGFLFAPMPRYITRNDISTNLLAYLPFGYLLARYLYRPGQSQLLLMLVCLAGALLSLAMESLQVLLPTRVASNLDILLNSLGALTGALLAQHHARWLRAGEALYSWRHSWFRELGTTPGLWLLAFWLLCQFALIPQPGVGWLYINLSPESHRPASTQMFNTPWFFSTFLELATVGCFTATLLKPGRYVGAVFLLLVIAFGAKLLAWAVLMKPRVMANILSPETMAAFIVALWLLLLPSVSRHRRGLAIALLCLTLLGRLLVVHSPLWPSGSLLNLVGLARHVAALWPWLVLAYLIYDLRPRRRPR